ncbi:MAG: hypothetical protein PHV38_00235 [Eubacteriales bacterium]|nr:hypothetical protein [Eubacteriales bacterium]
MITKITIKKLLVVIICLCLSQFLFSCDSREMEEKEEKLMLNWVQWSGGSLREDGSRSYWDPVTASYAKVNIMQVIYWPKDEKGMQINGVPTASQYQQVMDHAKYDIEISNDLGIDIIGYSDTVQFNIDNLKTEYTDIHLEDLCALNYRLEPVFTTAWDPKGLYVACINSPKWRELLKENVYLTAKAGFAGLQYDFHPYAAASYFCNCKHCQEGWKTHSKEVLGEELAIPRFFDFKTEAGREYYKWKIQCFADFMIETGSKAKEFNPDFQLLMNHNMNSYDLVLEILLGAVDTPTSEYHGVHNGVESSLYMYQLAEAFGKKEVFTVYNSADQGKPISRYKVNLAESFAVCGSMSFMDSTEGVAAFSFVNAHEKVYSGTHSMAEVGLMYSWESSLFSDIEINYNTLYYDHVSDISRQASTALVKAGICHDYLALEYEGVLDRMKQYKVLIIPEYDYFNLETWEEPLKKFTESGGKLIVLGDNAKNFVRSILDDQEGKIFYISDFTGSSNQSNLILSDDFINLITTEKINKQLVLLNNLEYAAATIRQGDPDIYIHIIHRGDDSEKIDKTQMLKFKIPERFDVGDVSVECPFENTEIKVEWDITEDGYLKITTDSFDTYLLITVISK